MLGEVLEALIYAALTGSKRRRGWVLFSHVISLEAILPASLYQFEGFELDLKRFELRRNGQALKLERIPMELLILLVSRNGDLVSREEIVEKLWGKNVFIEAEHSVNTAIRKIRQALEDDPDNPRFVTTVVGKGYRFSAAVRPCEPESVSAATEPNGPPPTVRSEKVPDPRLWLWVTATAVAMLIGIAFLANLAGNLLLLSLPSLMPLPVSTLSA